MDDRYIKLERIITESLVSLSALHAAGEVIKRRAERVHGIDPSETEEPATARTHLRRSVRDLEDLAFRLGMLQSEILESIDELSAAVARMDSLLVLNGIAQSLEDVHRRLLSLYPETSEDVIETTRKLAAACRDAVADTDDVAADDLFALVALIRRTCL